MQDIKALRRHKKKMRESKQTPAERIFRRRLHQLGIPFTRQTIIGFYIADFVIPTRMLVIELDGPIHALTTVYDARRDGFIRSLGFDVLRIQNAQAEQFDMASIVARPIVSGFNKNSPYRNALYLAK